LRVLLVAEHASAAFGGEALVPFQYFRQLRALGVDVHMLVHERTRAELMAAFPDDADRLHFVPDSAINVWCHKLSPFLPDRLAVFTLGALSHLDTQIRQRRSAKALIAGHRFDLVHESIPVSPKLPSMMFGLAAPVIIGPMNGGMSYPASYETAGPVERLVIPLLQLTAVFWNAIIPGKRTAAALLVANGRTLAALPRNLKQQNILTVAENGVDLDVFWPDTTRAPRAEAHIIYVGRLVDVKRVDLLLAACATLKDRLRFKLDLVGDGPLRQALEGQVRALALTSQVQFHGRLPQSVAAEMVRKADLMVLPSMHECGGAVVLEAMASGVPVVAARWGGPADYIDDDTGILIPPGTPDSFARELTAAILRLAEDPQLRDAMGKAGRRRIESHYDWRVKAKALVEIYRDVVGRKSSGMEAVAPEAAAP
jgi:glycosyltransferase involved in cell wall biosynthesis